MISHLNIKIELSSLKTMEEFPLLVTMGAKNPEKPSCYKTQKHGGKNKIKAFLMHG